MYILITETSTNKVIHKYPITLNNSTEEEYFNEAWRCAVEDKLVLGLDRKKYSFSFVR